MTCLILFLLIPLMLVTALLTFEVLVGLWPLTSVAGPPLTVSATIIVPAHNEEDIIARTLAALAAAAEGVAHILVVADNCSDSTATIARSLSLKVIERSDLTRIGKGFALDFARAELRTAPPEVVMVIDADCRVDRDSLRALIDAAARDNRPAQAINLLEPALDGSVVKQVSTFAFLIKNLVRQRALHRLAGQARLTGTGMAFPWSFFDEADLATGNIVEDLKLGIELAAVGRGARLIERARVWSPAAPESAAMAQRQRWEGGMMATARQVVPMALFAAIRRADPRALLAALDLCIPPLALLLMLDVAAIALLSVVTVVAGSQWWPLAIHAAILAAAGLAIILAWRREGKAFLTLRALARIPYYVLSKLPLYLKIGRRGKPQTWIRTDRALGADERANE